LRKDEDVFNFESNELFLSISQECRYFSSQKFKFSVQKSIVAELEPGLFAEAEPEPDPQFDYGA
jgi:hypothetical protein